MCAEPDSRSKCEAASALQVNVVLFFVACLDVAEDLGAVSIVYMAVVSLPCICTLLPAMLLGVFGPLVGFKPVVDLRFG